MFQKGDLERVGRVGPGVGAPAETGVDAVDGEGELGLEEGDRVGDALGERGVVADLGLGAESASTSCQHSNGRLWEAAEGPLGGVDDLTGSEGVAVDDDGLVDVFDGVEDVAGHVEVRGVRHGGVLGRRGRGCGAVAVGAIRRLEVADRHGGRRGRGRGVEEDAGGHGLIPRFRVESTLAEKDVRTGWSIRGGGDMDARLGLGSIYQPSAAG